MQINRTDSKRQVKDEKNCKIIGAVLYAFFHTACGQKQTEPHKDHINYSIKDTITSHGPNTTVRNVKQDRNGNILITASWSGVFRYDGKSFTNLTNSKIGSHRYWDVLEDRRGNLWFATTDSGVYLYNGRSQSAGQAGFHHFTTREGLVNNRVVAIYEDKAGIICFGTGGGVSRYDGKSFLNFTSREGLYPELGCIVMMERPLRILKVQPVRNNVYNPQF